MMQILISAINKINPLTVLRPVRSLIYPFPKQWRRSERKTQFRRSHIFFIEISQVLQSREYSVQRLLKCLVGKNCRVPFWKGLYSYLYVLARYKEENLLGNLLLDYVTKLTVELLGKCQVCSLVFTTSIPSRVFLFLALQ